jgi:hypothetical protein
MKKLVVFVAAAVGAYLLLAHKEEPKAPPSPAAQATTTPGANMQNRIDNLSGAAPAEP